MSLRIATPEDTDLVFSMATKFIEQTYYKDTYEPTVLRAVVEDYVNAGGEHGKLCLVYENKGMIVGLAYPFAFGTKIQITEVGWWVEPDARKEGVGKILKDALEYWGKKIGGSFISMGALDEKLEKFYVQDGYKLAEHIYIKDL